MNLPTILICGAAVVTSMNAVLEAMGKGPGNIAIPLTGEDPPDAESEITHFMMLDMSMPEADAAALQALTGGTLPEIEGTWGEDGVIAGAIAIAAAGSGNVQVYTAAGDPTPAEFVDGVLAARDLFRLPDPVDP